MKPIYIHIVWALLTVSGIFPGTAVAAQGRPNVILIMTDDQGYGDLSITGNEQIDTPAMDRIAKEGAWLKRFYVSPVCTPTRAHLMTGRYAYRTRAFDTLAGRANMEPDEVTVAEVLRDAGYATGIFGKWHLGDNYPTRAMDQGFQEAIVHQGGGLRQPSNPPEGARYHDPILFHNGEPKRFEGYCTDIYFDEAIRFIEQQTAKNESRQPFFVYLPTNTPHGPFDEPPTRELMEHFQAKFPGEKNASRASFYAMVKNIDNNMARLFARLKTLGIERDTLVIFLTDNGPSGGSAGPFRAKKGAVYEGGIRTVCFLRWPGVIEAGSSSDLTAAHIDLMPTILDLCGIAAPENVRLDGRSLRPLLAMPRASPKPDWPDRHLFLQWHRGNVPQRYHHFAVIGPQGQWKLLNDSSSRQVRMTTPPKFELYDLYNDIGEENDVADKHPDTVTRLQQAYDAIFDDVCSTREPNFGMPPIVIGSDQQSTVVLTSQDKRTEDGDKGSFWGAGYWPVDIRSGGPYTIEVLLNADVPKETIVKLNVSVGGEDFVQEFTVPRGVDSAAIGKITLPSGGLGRISALTESEERRDPKVYQVTIK